MWINDEYKIVFIAVPKCASTSMIQCLASRSCGAGYPFRILQGVSWGPENSAKGDPIPPEEYHASIKYVLQREPDLKDYFSFAFARNPWDRLVSTYYHGVQDKAHRDIWSSGLTKYTDFHEFVLDIPNSEWLKETHLKPCSTFVTMNNNIVVDFVGRYETINKDFGNVTRTIFDDALELNIHVHKSVRRATYREYYTPESSSIVEKLYSEDIENFGYEF